MNEIEKKIEARIYKILLLSFTIIIILDYITM